MDKARQQEEGVCTVVNLPGSKKQRLQIRFRDGTEEVEEYDLETGELRVRKWKVMTAASAGLSTRRKEPEWQYEIGDAPKAAQADSLLLASSSVNPSFHPRDHAAYWEWRVRNLPYDKSVYSVTVDDKAQELVLRTTNKKYFKRFGIAALSRAGLRLEEEHVAFKHADNTLIITYRKPQAVVMMETELRLRRCKQQQQQEGGGNGSGSGGSNVMKTQRSGGDGDEGGGYPAECKQS